MIDVIDDPVVGPKAVASETIPVGTILNDCSSEFEIFEKPTRWTIMYSENVNVKPEGLTKYISHACESFNTKVTFKNNEPKPQFTVIKEIPKGTDLSFNYNTTEWDFFEPFECSCDTCSLRILNGKKPNFVSGYRHLTLDEILDIHEYVSEYLTFLTKNKLA